MSILNAMKFSTYTSDANKEIWNYVWDAGSTIEANAGKATPAKKEEAILRLNLFRFSCRMVAKTEWMQLDINAKCTGMLQNIPCM